MNYAQCEEDQNYGIEFGTLVITDISRSLKGHTNKVKYVTVLFTKQLTYIHSKRIRAVPRDIQRNIGNVVKVGNQGTRENVRQRKKARLTGDIFEVFGITVVVGSHE